MNPPRPNVVPHPTVKGAWTLEDRLATPGEHIPLFASKLSAEVAAAAQNKARRAKL